MQKKKLVNQQIKSYFVRTIYQINVSLYYIFFSAIEFDYLYEAIFYKNHLVLHCNNLSSDDKYLLYFCRLIYSVQSTIACDFRKCKDQASMT